MKLGDGGGRAGGDGEGAPGGGRREGLQGGGTGRGRGVA